jgi:hypothetical protein
VNKRNAKDTARYDFMESLANADNNCGWENFANSDVESATTQSFMCPIFGPGEFMNNRTKNGFACQVCRFEERGKRLMSVVIA